MTTPWFQFGRVDPFAIVANVPQPFKAADEVQSWNATPQEVAATTEAIIVAGRVFSIDLDDTTSGHDGFYCCVSADGRRFKAGDVGNIVSVETARLVAPPTISSGIYGKAWIVPVAAIDAWAGHSGDIAIATARGWMFMTPEPGRSVYMIETGDFWHMSASGSWTVGLGGPSPGSVSAEALEWPWGIIIESRTLNTPPADGGRKAYVVGTAPLGEWAGKAGYLAIGPSGGWSYIPAVSGAEVWCREESRYVRFVSGAWTADAGSITSLRRAINDASISGGAYTYSATAPTMANTVSAGMTISHTARSSGNVVRIRFQCEASASGVVALFVDASASATLWGSYSVGAGIYEFLVVTSDASSHQYSIRTAGITATKSFITLEELSVLA